MKCHICDHETRQPDAADVGSVNGTTKRFREWTFQLWKCPKCGSIQNVEPVDFADIYQEYPSHRRTLDARARTAFTNLLGRLAREGLRHDRSVLDFGCGNGILMKFLNENGFINTTGFDPFVPQFADRSVLLRQYDCVIADGMLEHTEDPKATLALLSSLLRPGGMLYIGTRAIDGIRMGELDAAATRLHQPFHRVLMTESGFLRLVDETGLRRVASYSRSCEDTLAPFGNARFFAELQKALGHEMDRALSASPLPVALGNPRLLFYAFFGYLFPSAPEPAVIMKR